jgi:hypothetical protein
LTAQAHGTAIKYQILAKNLDRKGLISLYRKIDSKAKDGLLKLRL